MISNSKKEVSLLHKCAHINHMPNNITPWHAMYLHPVPIDVAVYWHNAVYNTQKYTLRSFSPSSSSAFKKRYLFMCISLSLRSEGIWLHIVLSYGWHRTRRKNSFLCTCHLRLPRIENLPRYEMMTVNKNNLF